MTALELRAWHYRQWHRYLDQASQSGARSLDARCSPNTREQYNQDEKNCRDLAHWHAQAVITLDALINHL